MDKTEIEASRFPEPVDLLSGKYIFHWTSVDKIPGILSRGLLSPKFASRIGAEDYNPILRSYQDQDPMVYFTPGMEGYKHVLANKVGYDRAVGVVVESPYGHERLRVAPRRLIALVVDDQTQEAGDSKGERVMERALSAVRLIINVCQQRKVELAIPVYGSSGGQFWPRQMSHEEIVQMLAEKRK